MRRLLPLLLLLSIPALAQAPHAMLTGTARSAKRGIAGVAVTVTSPALQGSRTTTTVANGDYFFDALPPGTYDIQFAKHGYATVIHRGILLLAQTARVDAELQPSQEEESITATGTTTTVLETPAIVTTIDSTLVDQLPMRRTIGDRVTLAPGDPIELGPDTAEGMILLNVFGFPDVVEDSIDQTTVISGASGPEYGRTIGGPILTITRSGGNNVSGSLRDTLTSDRWHATAPGIGPRSGAIHHSLEATAGGRVIADRLWFFLAGGHSRSDDAYRPDGFANIGFREAIHQTREQAKVTAAPTSWSSLTATGLHIQESLSESRGDHQNGGSIDATAMAGDHMLFEAMGSRMSNNFSPAAGVPFPALTARDLLLRGSWIGGNHTVTAGFDDTTYYGTQTDRALFANDRLHFGTHWLFNAGARVIDTPLRSKFFEPRVSAMFDVHGDGHSRWSIAYGQYLQSPLFPAEINETTLSYAMQIGGNGFIRVDGWYRQASFGSEGADFQGSYRFLGILDAGGNYTWMHHRYGPNASIALPTNRANLWLRVAVPGTPRGTLTAGILEQYQERTVSGIGLQYALGRFFAKADLLNAFNVGTYQPREFRLSLGVRI